MPLLWSQRYSEVFIIAIKKKETEKGRQQGDTKSLRTMSLLESKTKVMGTIPAKKVAFSIYDVHPTLAE